MTFKKKIMFTMMEYYKENHNIFLKSVKKSTYISIFKYKNGKFNGITFELNYSIVIR